MFTQLVRISGEFNPSFCGFKAHPREGQWSSVATIVAVGVTVQISASVPNSITLRGCYICLHIIFHTYKNENVIHLPILFTGV